MAKDLNQCNFIGRLGKDPEVKYLSSGDAVVNFSIACSDDYKDKSGNKVEQTNWINIIAYRKLAEIINQYTHKGSKVFVSGKQVTRKWQDQNGQDRYSTEIVANELLMLDSRDNQQPAQDSHNQENSNGYAPQDGGFDDFEDDIPFS